MTFLKRNRDIQEGDVAIAYINPKSMKAFKVIAGAQFQNTHGLFDISSFIGKPWGSKVANCKGNGFIHILYPTPELWTMVLPHRTQILYQPDISLVTMMLDLKPGVSVIECGKFLMRVFLLHALLTKGTGSGSFSHSIARTIKPGGQLYTFEYHEERAMKAKQEFEEHGLDIVINHRDVCQNGFDLKDTVQAGKL